MILYVDLAAMVHSRAGLGRISAPIALTVDVHEEDRPADVSRAAHWQHEHDLPATFFVPSVLFLHPDFRPHVTLLPSLGFEVGSHGHRHDYVVVR